MSWSGTRLYQNANPRLYKMLYRKYAFIGVYNTRSFIFVLEELPSNYFFLFQHSFAERNAVILQPLQDVRLMVTILLFILHIYKYMCTNSVLKKLNLLMGIVDKLFKYRLHLLMSSSARQNTEAYHAVFTSYSINQIKILNTPTYLEILDILGTTQSIVRQWN